MTTGRSIDAAVFARELAKRRDRTDNHDPVRFCTSMGEHYLAFLVERLRLFANRLEASPTNTTHGVVRMIVVDKHECDALVSLLLAPEPPAKEEDHLLKIIADIGYR